MICYRFSGFAFSILPLNRLFAVMALDALKLATGELVAMLSKPAPTIRPTLLEESPSSAASSPADKFHAKFGCDAINFTSSF